MGNLKVDFREKDDCGKEYLHRLQHNKKKAKWYSLSEARVSFANPNVSTYQPSNCP